MLTPLLPRYLSSLLSIQGHGGNTQHPSRALPPSPEECVPTAAVDRRQFFSAQIAAGIGIGGLASVFTTNVAPSSAYASLQKVASNYPPSPPSGTNTAAQRTMNFPRVHPGLTVGDTSTGVLCEIFVDFACPYSRKLVKTVLSDVAPEGSTYLDKMAFTFHNMIQPWHHQSLWLHESAFAVKILYPDVELAYWKALFEDAPHWYDKEIYGLTRAEFYDKLTAFAAGVVIANTDDQTDDDAAAAVKAKLLQYLIPPLQEGGHFPTEARTLLGSNPDDDENAVFPLSRQIVKYARKRGVHVTPTVFVNGIEQGQISSGWSKGEWTEFLSQALA